ncbi:MAG: ABC transporter permease [Acidimicrobiaceae bacterium]|nr:ABC transporter permease [Acidimicrobiaceae bacterium]
MSRLAAWVNPVLARELAERMRGLRATVMLSAYLGVLGLVVVLVYRNESVTGRGFDGSPVTELATAGEGIFEWTLLFAMLLVLFLVPGFTAGAVAGERERQTLVPLQVSLLRPSSIVLGKIGASVAFTLLLVLATLPLLTVAYLIGGVTLGDILQGTGMVMFTAVTVAALSVACSTFMRRVQTATVLSYGVVLLLCGATFAAYFVVEQIDSDGGFEPADPPRLILAPNPIVALADATADGPDTLTEAFFAPPFSSYGGNGPLSGLKELVTPDQVWSGRLADGAIVDFEVAPDGDIFGVAGRGGGPPDQPSLPLWAQHILIMGALAALSVFLSSLRLRTPAKTER